MIHRRGYLLVEILIVLSLLSVFALVVTQVFENSLRLSQQSVAATESAAHFDSAIALLRADVQQSKSSQVPEPKRLVLTTVDGQTIEWKTTDNQFIRSVGNNNRSWQVNHEIKFAMEGSLVLIQPSVNRQDDLAIAISGELTR